MAEDLIARYQLDISDLKLQVKNLESEYAKLDSSQKKTAKSGEDGFKKTGDAIKKTSEETSGLTSGIEEIGKSIIAAFAVERVLSFAKESVKAFAEAESAAKKLETAVGVSGGLQKDYERLIAQSSALQESTIFGDDDIQAVQTAALQYGLTADQVQRLIPILTDFASATGSDLASAFNSVISATEGSERALRGQGVVIDTSISKAENFDSILNQLNNTFEGQAQIVAGTAAGALKQYDNQIGELQESLGAKIAPAFQALQLGILGFANDLFRAFDPDTYKGKDLQEQLIKDAQLFDRIKGKMTKESLEKEIAANKVRIDSGKESINVQQRLLNWNRLYTEQLNKINSQAVETYKVEKESTDALIKKRDELKGKSDFNSRSMLEQVEKEIKKRKDAEEKNKQESEKTFQAQKANIDKLAEITSQANQKTLELTKANEAEKLNIQRQAEIDKAKVLFEAAGGTKNKQAVIEYNKAVAAINSQYDELIKQSKIKSAQETYNELARLSEQNSNEDLKNTLDIIEINSNAEIARLKQAYKDKGDFSKEAEKQLAKEIAKVKTDADKLAIDETNKFRVTQIENQLQLELDLAKKKLDASGNTAEAQKQYETDVANANAKANDSKYKNDLDYAKKTTDLSNKTTETQSENESEGAENFIESNEEKIKAAQQAAGEILNALGTILDAQVKAKEDELSALQNAYDAEDEELKRRFEQRLIGAADFEKQQSALKQKRVEDEKKIQEEIKKLKRQEDIANRARAIFDIIINTAVSVSKLLDKPFLAIAAGIAGAAQLTTVLATPLPKYAKGTKWLKRGNNPLGVDTIPILADEGERIIPRDRNRKYWSIYEAIDDNKFDSLIQQKYIAPALKKQLKEFNNDNAYSLAQNISSSLMMNHNELASKIGSEIEWRNRNGIKVKGMDELISALTKQSDIRKR